MIRGREVFSGRVRRLVAFASGTVLLCVLGGGSGWAQQPPAAAGDTGVTERPPLYVEMRPLSRNSSIITARRWHERAMDVPGGVKVLLDEEIEEAGLDDTTDLAASTAGMSLTSPTGNGRVSNFSVRGLASAVFIGGVDQPTALYVDDVFVGNTASFNMDLLDVKRVEILRGPQGALYGKNALAGAIKIRTYDPISLSEGDVEASYGNYEFRRGRGVVNGELVPGALAGRLTASWAKRDGFVHNSFDDSRIDTLDSWGARGKLATTAPGRLSLVGSFDFSQNRPVRSAGGPFETIADHETSFTDNYEERRNIYGAALNASWRGDDWSLTSITAVRGVEFAAQGSDFTPNDLLRQGQDDEQLQVSQELRIASDGKAPARWLAGLFLYHDDHRLEAFQALRGLAGPFAVPFGHRELSVGITETDHVALFGHATRRFADNWEVGFGLRALVERKSLDYRHAADSGTAVLATAQTADISETFFELAPEATLGYRFSEFVNGYLRIARGVRSGGFNNGFVSGSRFVFEPETGINYEAGIKSILLDNRLDLSGSAFYMDIKDQQTQSLIGPSATITSNAAQARTMGIELQVAARPTRWLELFGDLSLIDARFEDYPDFPVPTLADPTATTDVSGKRLPFYSPLSFSVGARYQHPVAPWTYLRGQIEYRYAGRMHFDARNRVTEPARSVVDARLGLHGLNWRAALWVKNLFDEPRRLFGADLGPGIGVLGIAAPPRTFGVTVGMKF